MKNLPLVDLLARMNRKDLRAVPAVLGFCACAAVAGLSLAACASPGASPRQDPCRTMREQVEEKQKLDAQVRQLAKQAETYRKEGDTASAVSAEDRLQGLRQSQRLLKETVEQSGRDCRPTWQDPQPVRDPASRDIAPQ